MRTLPLPLFIIGTMFVVGCASTPPANSPDAPPEATNQPPPPVPPPTAGIVYVPGMPKYGPEPEGFYAEINGVPLKLSGGETVQTEEDRMVPLYNFAAKSDCSDSEVEALVKRPGPVCVAWFAPHELGMKSGESRSAKWKVGAAEVSFTVKVK